MEEGLSEQTALRELYIQILKDQTANGRNVDNQHEKGQKLLKLKNVNRKAEDTLHELRKKCQMLGLENRKILINEIESVDEMSVDFQPAASAEQSLKEFDSVFSNLPNPPIEDKNNPASPDYEMSQIKSEKEAESSVEKVSSTLLETEDVEMEEENDGERGLGSNIDFF